MVLIGRQVVLTATVLCAVFSITLAQPSISPTLIQGQVGENVTFSCTSVDVNGGENNFLEFQVMNGRFEVFDSTDGRLNRIDSGAVSSFTFGPLMSSDNGLVLRCASPNGIGAQTAMISVTFAVVITGVNPDNRTITLNENRGEQFNLTVAVEGNPIPSYTWTRNGVPLTNGSTLTVTANSLYAYLVRGNTGLYEVVYDNTLGRASHSFTLDIQYRPEFPADPIADSLDVACEEKSGVYVCVARIGSNVTLLCNAMGNPSPMIAFTPTNTPTSGNNIVFPEVALSDAGNYTCTASSAEFDDVERRFQLIVGDSSAGNIGASHILSLLMITLIVLLF